MPLAPEATSPATPGDGNAATNVSANDLIAQFSKGEEVKSTPQPANTSPPPALAEEAAPESPAAQPAEAGLPEAEVTPNPETPETTTTEGQVTEEAEADGVLSPESQQLDPKTKEKIQKRIDKEVGKRKAIEGHVAQLQKELADLKAAQPATPPQPTPAPIVPTAASDAPLPEVKNPADLVAYRKQTVEYNRVATDLIDRDDIDWTNGIKVPGWGDKDGNGKDIVYTKEQVRNIRNNTRLHLDEKIPDQQAWFQQTSHFERARQEATARAHQDFPYLKDKNTQEYAAAQKAYEQMPWLRNAPNAEYIIGVQIEGLKAMEAKRKAAATPPAAPAPKPAPVVVKPKPPSDQAQVSTASATVRSATPPRVPASQGNLSKSAAAKEIAARELAKLGR